jgi:hypothetical protein
MTIDPDFGWHLRNGEYFIENGIHQVEPYTYTASDFPYIDHEPISDIVLYHVNAVGGYELVSVMYAGLWTLSLWLVWRMGDKRNRLPVAIVFLVALAIVPYTGIRTLMWSLLGLAVMMNMMAGRWVRWLLPVLFLWWVNFHGSFVVGLAVMVYMFFYEYVWQTPKYGRNWKQIAGYAVIWAASVGTTMINPYGWEVYIEVFRTLFDPTLKWTIAEWQPDFPILAIPYLLIVVMGVFLTIRRWRLRDYARAENVFLLAALWTQRHWPLFMLYSMPQTTERVNSEIADLERQARRNHRLSKLLAWVVGGVVVITVGLMAYYASFGFDRYGSYPLESVAYLQEKPCAGNLLNEYNVGGYLIWQLPSHKVYIDGRGPSWQYKGTFYMMDYIDIMKPEKKDFREEQFSKWNIKCALLYEDREIGDELVGKGWQKVVEGDNGFVLLVEGV